jgi:V/A-type H+-transporting ATPase subunit A
MREMSGRLEEIPGEEAFPAYLESVIAAFYERAGRVTLRDGGTGSVTIGGTVSPAGGNFEEPVTQATLKVVGAFHGLSRERSDARRYPSIDPLESWSKYRGPIDPGTVEYVRDVLHHGNEVGQMMKVVGEEGTSLDDYVVHLKSEFLDSVYLQQNAFDPVDAAVGVDRQRHVFDVLLHLLTSELEFKDKGEARNYFANLRQRFLDYNGAEWQSEEFKDLEQKITAAVNEKRTGRMHTAEHLYEEATSEEG